LIRPRRGALDSCPFALRTGAGGGWPRAHGNPKVGASIKSVGRAV